MSEEEPRRREMWEIRNGAIGRLGHVGDKNNEYHRIITETDQLVFFDQSVGHYIIDDRDVLGNHIVEYLLERNEWERVNEQFVPKAVKKYRQILNRQQVSIHDFHQFSTLAPDGTFHINLGNGKLEIYTKDYKEERPAKPHLTVYNRYQPMLSKIKINWNPDAECPLWLKTLDEVIPNGEDQTLFRSFLAYSLISKYFKWECILYLYGIGHNGKSTLLAVWSTIFNKVAATKIHELEKDFGLSQVSDADFCFADESETDPKTLSIPKAIASGTPLTINKKRKDMYDKIVDLKIAATSNSLLKTKSTGDRRKILYVRCPTVFAKNDNVNLREELIGETEGILKWAIEQVPYLINEMSNLKKTMAKRSEEFYEKYSNPFDVFCDIILVEAANGYVSNNELARAYEIFSNFYQHDSLNNRTLGQKLRRYFKGTTVDARRTSKERGWSNLQLNEGELIKMDATWVSNRGENDIDGGLDEYGRSLTPSEELHKWLVGQNGRVPMDILEERASELTMDAKYFERSIGEWKRAGRVTVHGDGLVEASGV